MKIEETPRLIFCILCLLMCGLETASAARGRPTLNAERTTFVADNGELLRGPFTSTEWTSAVPESEIVNMKNLGFNAVHLYAEVFDPDYPAAGSTSPGYNAAEVDKIVQYTRDAGMYLVMTIGNGANNGNHNAQWAHDFWAFYAPRYAAETHVIYEIHNEPVAWGPPYSSSSATPPGAVDMEIDCYNTIRASAPDTPVLLFSYAVLGDTGGANSALTDIHAFNTSVFGSSNVAWTNEAIGFHGYAGASANATAVDSLINAGYPCFMTEFATGTWGGENGGLDVEAVANLERLGVSWLTFQFVPPWGVSDNITTPSAYEDRVNNSGLSWTPDYGTWPVARSVYGNGGDPWSTAVYVNNTLSGTLRIQAENFDQGGEGVAYHDIEATNTGGQYRTDEGVDIQTTSDSGGGYNVNSIEAGEWLEYTVKASEAGMYNLRLRVAGTSGGRVQVLAYGEDITGEWTLPGTGGTQTWTTVTKSVFLQPGQQLLRIQVLEGGFNLNWIELSVQSTGPLANGTYKLLNAASGQAMDLNADNNVVVSDYTGAANEQWVLQNIGGGQYRVTSVGDGDSWTTWAGPLHIGTWWGASGDRCFIFRPTGDGFYRIFSAGGGRSFQPSGGDALLDDVVYSGAPEQKWAVVTPSTPAFPANLRAILSGSGMAQLSWDAVSGATSYQVKRSTTSGGPYTTIATGVISATYTDSGLTNGVQYYYVVSALSGTAESLNSAEAELSYPELMGNIIGTAGSWNNSGNTIAKVFDDDLGSFFDAPTGNGVWVGLDFGAGASNVITQINYCPRSDFPDRMVGGVFQGANQANFSGAVTLYTITSQPSSGGFTSVEISNTQTFRFVRYLSPNSGYGNVAELEFYGYSTIPVEPVPSGLTAVAVSGSQIDLGWNALTNATGYSVKRATVSGGPYTTIASDVVETTYSDTGLSGGTTYYYVVSAETASGESGDSMQASATPTLPYDGGPWTIPGRIEAENYDQGGQGVAYNDSTDGNAGGGYRSDDVDVEVCGDTGGGYNIGYTTVGEWLQYTIEVETSGIYDITVRAASQWAQIDTHVEVDGVDVTGSMTAPATGAWQTYTDVTAANIALSAGPHVLRVYFDAPDFNINYIDLSAVALVPDAPGGLDATGVSANRIDLTWTASENAESYTVMRAMTSGAPYETIASNVVATSWSDTNGLDAGNRYYYVVSAVNAGGESDHSDETSAVPSAVIIPQEYLIADHAVVGGSNLSLTVSNTVPGHDYQIRASDSLTEPDWQWIGVLQGGTGSNLVFNIPIDGTSANRYFKLEVQRQ